jgi:hypothetical protein
LEKSVESQWPSTIISKPEAEQISQEIALCLGSGLTSWQILKTLRFIRQAVQEGKTFTLEKHDPPHEDAKPDR